MDASHEPRVPVDVERHRNNFDFLRFAAAFLVIAGHCFVFTVKKEPSLDNVGLTLIGIDIFFIISGYLIAKSWDRNRSVIRFFTNRFLRLYPALACACLFTAFIVGPLVTQLPLGEYLTNLDTWKYLSTISIIIQQPVLPGVFNGTPVSWQLWTLTLELYCYIALAVLGILGLLYRKYVVWCIFFLLFAIIVIQGIRMDLSWIWRFTATIAGYGIYFVSGTLYYQNFDKNLFNVRLLATVVLVTIAGAYLGLFHYILYIILPYLVLYCAFLPVPALNNFGNHGDYSYGMYIYGYQVQKTIVYFLGNLPVFAFLIISLVCIFPLAYCSWHGIEKRALSKKKYPSAGVVRSLS